MGLLALLPAALIPWSGDLPLGQEARAEQRPLPAQTRAALSLPAWPERLSLTGLYVAGSTTAIDPSNLPYTPQYPLWSDGASKRRWLRLPEGERIDASDPERWHFPAGTLFYKEFSHQDAGVQRRTETRVLELTSSGARYATYVWNADDTEAVLAPERGMRAARTLADGSRYDVPSRLDCTACHEGQRTPVLGFDALQLSPDRDPLAPNRELPLPGSLDLAELVRRDLIENLPWSLVEAPPRIAASTPVERAAQGYLLGNCAHCHNAEGPLAPLGLDLDQPISGEARAGRLSGLTAQSKFSAPGVERAWRVVPGAPEQSVVALRMRSLSSAARMPPLGTWRVDTEGVSLIERWITEGSM